MRENLKVLIQDFHNVGVIVCFFRTPLRMARLKLKLILNSYMKICSRRLEILKIKHKQHSENPREIIKDNYRIVGVYYEEIL